MVRISPLERINPCTEPLSVKAWEDFMVMFIFGLGFDCNMPKLVKLYLYRGLELGV